MALFLKKKKKNVISMTKIKNNFDDNISLKKVVNYHKNSSLDFPWLMLS